MTKNNQDQPYLSLKNLSFYREWDKIIHEFNLSLYPGQWLILKGSNGCGKTTLLKLCAKILTPTTGLVHHSCPYGYLGHQNGIKPMQTLSSFIHKLSSKRDRGNIQGMIDFLTLSSVKDVPFYHLSAGLKRKVALVHLFAIKGSFYLLDEPLSHLDSFSCQQVWRLLIQMIEKGQSILMSHHGSYPLSYPKIREVVLHV